MTKRNATFVVGLVILVMTMFLAVGCGGDDSDSAEPAEPAPAEAAPEETSPAPEPETPPEPSPTPAEEPAPVDEEAMDFSGETLRVSAFSGAFLDTIGSEMVSKFEADTGANVELVGTAGEEVSTILAAPADQPPFDVSVVSAPSFLMGSEEGLWIPVDTSIVTNHGDYTEFHASSHDAGIDISQGVPFDYGFFGILYNKEELEFEPATFNDFFRPEVQGRIGLEPVNWWAWLPATALASDSAPGVDELYNEAGHDELITSMQELDVALWASTLAETTAAMERGDIAIAYVAVEQAQPLIESDPDKFGFVIPEEGTAGFMDYFAVVRGTEKEELGQLFLNYLTDAQLQAAWAESIPYWMSNANVEYGPKASSVLPPTVEERENIAVFLDWTYLLNNWDIFDERLTREVYT